MDRSGQLYESSSSASRTLRRRIRPVARITLYLWHRLFPRSSYAADFEDKAAWVLLGGVKTFVDIGANDGFSCSNTFLFATRGAIGICFEPDRFNFGRLIELYCWQRAVECVAQGISDKSCKAVLRCDGLLSTIEGTEDPGLEILLAAHRNSDAALLEIELTTLSHWFSERPSFIGADVLSVDVEGHELCVLQGIDWSATPKPARCIIVETHAHGLSGSWRHRDFDGISELLASHAYRMICASSNNTVWLHSDDITPSRVKDAQAQLPHYKWFVS